MMHKYGINVFWSEPDECYVAVSPEFESLSAVGDTPEEALAEMQTVLRMAMATYQDEGWVLPEPKVVPEYSGQFRVRLPKSLHGKLAIQAEREGVSLNTLVVDYLAAGVTAKSITAQAVQTVMRAFTQMQAQMGAEGNKRSTSTHTSTLNLTTPDAAVYLLPPTRPADRSGVLH